MELNKGIDILKAYRVGGYGTLMDIRVMFEAIDTVLNELGRLTQENKELKQKINDFVEEMRCME